MKRNKIKPKYLKLININTPTISNYKKQSLTEEIEHIILKFLISFGLILLLMFWSYIPMLILAIFGIDYTNFSEVGKIIYMLISELLLLVILIKVYYKDIKRDFMLFFNHNFKDNIKIALRYWGMGLIVMVLSNYLIAIVTNGQLANNEEAVRELIQLAPLYMAFELMIYAPVSEEIIFRRSIRDIVKNPYLYSIISGLIFGGLHAITSVSSLIDLLYFIPYCSLGFVFALLYSKTNNIFSTISIHAIHNTLALILYLSSL